MPSEAFEITSPQNQRFKAWLKLLEAKGIKKQAEALLAGRSFIHEVISHYPEKIQAIITDDEKKLALLAIPEQIPVYHLTYPLFSQLDTYGTKAPILLIKAPPLPIWNGALAPGLTVFLPLQNPINLGTTIRTAAAFNAKVVLLQEAASPYLPKSLRASGPAIFQTDVLQGPSLADLATPPLRIPLFALSPIGKNIFSCPFPATAGLVAGPEGPGLDAYWPHDQRVSIPMQQGVESLNAAIAIAVGLTCYYSQHTLCVPA